VVNYRRGNSKLRTKYWPKKIWKNTMWGGWGNVRGKDPTIPSTSYGVFNKPNLYILKIRMLTVKWCYSQNKTKKRN